MPPRLQPALDTPLVCPTVVGRDGELAALEGLLRGAHGAPLRVAVVTGEAGIGKSRLVQEVAERARREGWAIISGAAFEPDLTTPFALAAELAHSARLRARRELTSDRILWRRWLSRRSGRPVLIIAEDAHWGDEASLQLLELVCRDSAALPVVILLTARSGASTPQLLHLLAALERTRVASELRLGPLTPAAVANLIAATLELQQTPRAEFSDAIASLTDGNPFFIEETLRALVAQGDIMRGRAGWNRLPMAQLRVPHSVQEAVLRRTAALSEDGLGVLRLAAVAGRRLDRELLATTAGASPEAIAAAFAELLSTQLIVESDGDLVFRHELGRRAVLESLPGFERRPLHERVLRALEGRPGADPGDLALHATAAEAWEEAQRYSRLAGAAAAAHAPRAAMFHFGRALEAAAHLAEAAPAEVLLDRALAAETAGEFDIALDAFGAALTAAREQADAALEADALLGRGLLWSSRDFDRAAGDFASALHVALHAGDRSRTAQAENRLANWHLNQDRAATALELHRRALATFRELGDRRGIADTLDFIGMAAYISGDLDGSDRAYADAAPLLAELDDPARLSTGSMMRMVCSGSYHSLTLQPTSMDPAGALALGERALRLARSVDSPSGECVTRINLALHLGHRGEYGEALRHARSVLELAEHIQHRQWIAGGHLALGAVLTDALFTEDARGHLRQGLDLAKEIGSRNWVLQNAAFLAIAAVADGDLGVAEAALEETGLDPAGAPSVPARLCWYARAQAAVAGGRLEQAIDILDRLTSDPEPPALARVRGQVLVLQGRPAEAEMVLQAALEVAVAGGWLPLEWRLRGDLAHALIKLRRRVEADAQIGAAARVIEELASRLPAAERFKERALRSLPPARGRTRRQEEKAASSGLTAREREVARFIAAGLTNQQLAAALFLSRRTVEDHVARILGKLGFDTRTQLAAWAVTNLPER